MGADHLCALAVVAAPGATDVVRAGARAPTTIPILLAAWRSFALGLRWGVGHGAGLAVVCAVFFALRRDVDLDRLGDVTDKVVGASMVVLGVVSLASLRRWRARRRAEREHIADRDARGAGERDIHRAAATAADPDACIASSAATTAAESEASPPHAALVLEAASDAHAAAHELDLPHVHVASRPLDEARGANDEDRRDDAGRRRPAGKPADARKGGGDPSARSSSDALDASAEASAAARSRWSAGIGFVHGLAGPSGVLAVLPGVVLADASASASYLVAFFLASTASMGAFAALFGAATHGATRRAAAESEARGDDRDEERGLSKGGAEAEASEWGSAGEEGTEADARATRERVSDRATRLAMALNLFAACAALAVGALWLALSSLGLLGSL
jgi:hypothetical protein